MLPLLKLINILPILLLAYLSNAQDSLSYGWSSIGEIEIGEHSFFTVDNLNNVYYTKDRSLIKVDSVFKLKFKQSIKSLGDSRQLTAVNSMKLVHFSWQQQTLCFFDNTLTQSEDCIDLFDLGLNNVTQIASSQRPNRLWLFNEVNSVLTLLNTDDVKTSVQLVNLSGVLEIDSCARIMERNNKLFLHDPVNGVFIFDQFGSLIDRVEMPHVEAIEVHNESLLLLRKDELISYDLRSGEQFKLKLPVEKVSALVVRDNFFYLRRGQIVHKFHFQL